MEAGVLEGHGVGTKPMLHREPLSGRPFKQVSVRKMAPVTYPFSLDFLILGRQLGAWLPEEEEEEAPSSCFSSFCSCAGLQYLPHTE